MGISEARRGEKTGEGFVPVTQFTTRGEIEQRYYPVEWADELPRLLRNWIMSQLK